MTFCLASKVELKKEKTNFVGVFDEGTQEVTKYAIVAFTEVTKEFYVAWCGEKEMTVCLAGKYYLFIGEKMEK